MCIDKYFDIGQEMKYRWCASVGSTTPLSHNDATVLYGTPCVPEEFLHLTFLGVVGDLMGEVSGSASSLWF